jgi:alginate O-acetyltransferase complex protein AlgI
MSYLSPEFAVFFLAFLVVYWSLGKWNLAQKIVLLIASYGLYLGLDVRFGTILGIYSLCVIALLACMRKWPQLRRVFAAIGIIGSVLNLAVFKYFDFFRETIQNAASAVDLNWALPALDILLPVGISFYTFQSIAYIVAVGRGERAPGTPLDTALYLAFFPTLLAGPICRPDVLLAQIESKEKRQLLQADRAIWLILSALVKKVWLASWLADAWVKPLFANPDAYQGLELLVGMYAFAVQIYLDFSGYSDLVIGMALLLGYQLPANFNYPYLAQNLREFWRRWHISLSTWIRDYVYIPLGGSRKGWWMAQGNLLSAMVISGIWHGASLKYIIWGAMHGFGVIAQNIIEKFRGKPVRGVLATVITFHLVCVAWVFFRADGWHEAVNYLSGFGRFDGPLQLNVVGGLALLVVFFVASYFSQNFSERALAWLNTMPLLLKPLVLATVVLVITLLGPSGVPAFLYYSY